MRAGSARLRVGAGEPVGSFPTVFDAEAGALCGEAIVERGLAHAAAGFQLAIRPGHLIMQAEDFRDPLAQEGPIVGPGSEATNVDGPEIHGLLALRSEEHTSELQ